MTLPIWTLYDVDLSTNLGVLHPLDGAKLYLQLNDTGTGNLTIHGSDNLANTIALDQYVNLTYNGNSDYGFFIEHIEYTDGDEKEIAGQVITISGPGNMALLADAVEWDWMTPGIEDVRHWGTADIITPYKTGAPVPAGMILYHLLDEAENDQTLPWNPAIHINRYCWNWPPGAAGTLQLTWDFDDVNDSSGNPWTDAIDIDLRVGTSLLDILRQFAALGYDFICSFDSGVFKLSAYPEPAGNDLTGSFYFYISGNVTKAIRIYDSTTLTNADLVEFTDPASPFVVVEDATSQLAHRRRESLLQASNATSATTATTYGTKEMAITKDPKEDNSVTVYDDPGIGGGGGSPRVFIDYNLGDKINYAFFPISSGLMILVQRIMSIQLEFPKDHIYADVTVKLETPL